jgi:ribulose-bisphosphate carboxylase large chain
MERLIAVYHLRVPPGSAAARATGIAVEQSVEMPVAAVTDPAILRDIVGQVDSVTDMGGGVFEARIGLSVATTGLEAGQLLNMLFGNTSMHPDITLADAEFPETMLKAFGGPRHGLEGLRKLAGAQGRAMTCSALKPQGSDAKTLAALAGRLSKGGLDFVKDDHGIADQHYSPFAERVPRIAEAMAARPSTCRRCPGTLSPCASRSRSPAKPASRRC